MEQFLVEFNLLFTDIVQTWYFIYKLGLFSTDNIQCPNEQFLVEYKLLFTDIVQTWYFIYKLGLFSTDNIQSSNS